MKKIALLLAIFAIGLQSVLAQTKEITGTVTSADDGSSIPGVSVSVKGTTLGTITDLDGKYTLKVPETAKILVFSFVGMQTEEVAISGSTVNAVLKSDVVGINEVVVTALGIKGNKDRMASSVTSVNKGSLETTGESGVLQSLSGKTSSVNVVRNSGDPGAGAYIQIRGQNTITGSNQPLIIIDGIPVINTSRGAGAVDGVVQQSRLNDINPNDIESIDILKGAAAAAVWGTRAANGVIVITTKNGNPNKKVAVNIYTGLSFDKVNIEQKKQSTWGQGSSGAYSATSSLSWGDKIASRAGGDDAVDKTGRYFEGTDGTLIYPLVTKNSQATYNDVNRDQVFRTGVTSEIGADVSLTSDKSQTFISFSNWDQDGIIKGNSNYTRNTLRVNYVTNPTDKVRFKLNTSYSNIASDRIQQGSNLDGLYLGYLRTPADFDNTIYKGTFHAADGTITPNSQRGYRNYLGSSAPAYNNPGWTINEQVNKSLVERLILNPEIKFDLVNSDKLTSDITARFGYDLSNDRRQTFFPVNSASSYATGYYSEEWLIEAEKTFDIFTRNIHKFDKFNFTWTLGGQYNSRKYNEIFGEMSNFINTTDQIYDFANATTANKDVSKYESEKNILAGYVVLNFDIIDQIFLEMTGRTEKSNATSKTIFYPSLSAGWQFSDLIEENDIFSFGKLRASVATVGIEPPLYITSTDFVSAGVSSGWGPTLDATYYGGGLQRSNIQGNADIEPERKTEFEVGTDLRFLKNRLSINFSYYNNKTTGAIFDVTVPASTGYASQYANAADLSNKGIELDLTGTAIKKKDFAVDINMNYSRNKNLVTSLSGVSSIFLNGFTGVSSRAVEDQPLGVLWGGRWDRDDNGDLILDDNGFPTQALDEGVLGDPNPDWRGALGLTVRYKGLSLKALFETSQGGDMWAGTESVMEYFGIAPVTANEVTLTEALTTSNGSTKTAGTTLRGNITDFGAGNVLLDQSWYTNLGGGFGPIGEIFVHDASWTRLREVTLSYDVPKSLVSKIGVGSLKLDLTGRNLYLWSKFADKYGVDPESNLTGVSNGRGLDYFTNPSSKSILVKLSIGF